jgi:hypothetical protein
MFVMPVISMKSIDEAQSLALCVWFLVFVPGRFLLPPMCDEPSADDAD